MYFNRTLSSVEFAYLAGFVLIYTVYIFRTTRFARQLRTTARSLVIKFILRTACFGLLVLALLQPSFGETEGELRAMGRDVLVLVDVSRSMNATDVQPSRLEKVKFELNNLFRAFPDDRFGLIVFTSAAHLQCPLTNDHAALRLFIESLTSRVVATSGTAFTPALSLALRKINADGSTQSKALVLLSDGEDFGPTDRSVVRALRRAQIPVLALGVGTPEGSVLTDQGEPIRDEAGERVVTRLEPDRLRQLARDTNGGYFAVTNRQNEFPVLIERLKKLERRLVDQRKVLIAANKYAYFLVGALVLLCLDVLVTVRTFRL